MTDDEFLAAFEACAFTRPEWTHEAHVRMAWLYLTRLPVDEALDRVRAGIQKLNGTIGSPDGYHETITVAFVRVIASRLRIGDTFAAFRDRNPDLFDRTLTALLRHYTKDRLWSPEARRAFIEPDVEPLPEINRGFRPA
jgi:hypothetical protein